MLEWRAASLIQLTLSQVVSSQSNIPDRETHWERLQGRTSSEKTHNCLMLTILSAPILYISLAFSPLKHLLRTSRGRNRLCHVCQFENIAYVDTTAHTIF